MKVVRIETKENIERELKPMSEMKPLEVCVIHEDPISRCNEEHIVMRTASLEKFEVIDLTDLEKDSCWIDSNVYIYEDIKVRPYKGKKLTLILE